MLEDIFKDTYAYKEIAQRGREEGREEGHAEGRVEGHAEGRVEGFATSILTYVQMKFDDAQLSELARTRVAQINETDALHRLFAHLITLSTAEEVRRALEELA